MPDSGSPTIVPVAEAKAAESGTRLEARYYVGEDGAKQFAVGWFDSERNENCTLQPTLDGVTRCLPPTWLAVGSVYYLDADCSQGLVRGAATLCEGEGKYAIRLLTNVSCGGVVEHRIWNVGEVVEPSSLYSLNSQGFCSEEPPEEGVTYRRLGAEVPLTAFVAVQEQVDP